jgi:hypothetical protein
MFLVLFLETHNKPGDHLGQDILIHHFKEDILIQPHKEDF